MSKENGNCDPVFSVGDIISGFELVKKIDEGGFGQVFKCTKDNKFYAMKLELNSQQGGSAIKLEMNVLKHLMQEIVFPKYILGGRRRTYHYLVLELLGDSLKMLKARSPNPEVWSDGTWSRVGIQCLYALKVLHNNGFVHRDIKPNNFAIGMNSVDEIRSRRILLFDFGLARRFILNGTSKGSSIAHRPSSNVPESIPLLKLPSNNDSKMDNNNNNNPSAEKIPPKNKQNGSKEKKKKKTTREGATKTVEDEAPSSLFKFRLARPSTDFRGTYQYASPNAHALIELGRHDDVWSLMYMVAEMFYELPWSNAEEENVLMSKSLASIRSLFTSGPVAETTKDMVGTLIKINDHLYECNYYSHPNYEIVHELFRAVMEKAGVSWSTPYDWETVEKPSERSKTLKAEQKGMKGAGPWDSSVSSFFKEDKWRSLTKPTPPRRFTSLKTMSTMEQAPSAKSKNKKVIASKECTEEDKNPDQGSIATNEVPKQKENAKKGAGTKR